MSECDSPSTEKVQLRDGETRDVSSHAAKNIELIREGERDGAIDTDDAEAAIERIAKRGQEAIDDE